MKDKETPKKVRVDDDGWFCCPNCNGTFGLINHLGKRNKYCGDCGQRIDWSDHPIITSKNKREELNGMDIGSGTGFPSAALSNFTPHPFIFDGVACASMEGLLQSFNFSNPDMQKEVCKLVGKQAKFKGKKKKWWKTQTLFWKDKEYKRDSKEYQELLDRAFDALATNSSFKKALLATGNATLTHSIGKNKIEQTVLTKQEFCSRLTKIRERLKEEVSK